MAFQIQLSNQIELQEILRRDLEPDLHQAIDSVKDIDAIAVPLGPGETQAAQLSIDTAIKVGNERNLQVLPINLNEAPIFAKN